MFSLYNTKSAVYLINCCLFRMHLQRVMKVMMKTWVPCPRKTDRSMPILGGLNTSPCTCFQPDSSWTSSCRKYNNKSQYDFIRSSGKSLWTVVKLIYWNCEGKADGMCHTWFISDIIYSLQNSFLHFFTLIGEHGIVYLHSFYKVPEAKQSSYHNHQWEHKLISLHR